MSDNKHHQLIFWGTPDFAVPSFLALAENNLIAAIVTQPDKPRGRSNRPVASPVKTEAQRKNIPVLQPEKLDVPKEKNQSLKFLETRQVESLFKPWRLMSFP